MDAMTSPLPPPVAIHESRSTMQRIYYSTARKFSRRHPLAMPGVICHSRTALWRGAEEGATMTLFMAVHRSHVNPVIHTIGPSHIRNYTKDCKRCVQKLYLVHSVFLGLSHWASPVQGNACVKAFSTAHRKQSHIFFPSQTTHSKMNGDYSYVGVPATTEEAMAKDHPIESETHTLARPEAAAVPKLSASTLVSPFPPSIPQNLTSW